ncbi:exodeoxyribonuclease VII large subunit [Hyalangium versicolor]|uniref:exodeoxyribonuclease VII large subunit n=1 Tax=Hyalangium versicolor TaxID=2861190 RepID=UPI001CCEFB1F|nr:exodeoxyribonuclease VII large subunit [Hyalangium versicolor]
MSRRVINDGLGTLQIHSPYDRRLVDVIKTLPGRHWNGTERFWSVPEKNIVAVVNHLYAEGFDFCENTRRLYRERGGDLVLDTNEHKPGAPPKQVGAATDLTVSQLNEKVQGAIQRAFPNSLWLVGEISGFNKARHRSVVGFELVERDALGKESSRLKAVIFGRTLRALQDRLATAGEPFQLDDEIQVRVRGRVDLYIPWGSYQFVIEDLDPDYTLGEAARRQEELRRRLAEEGLLERNRSLPFPPLPLRVGLVTSLNSDAYHDVLRTLEESGLAFDVLVHGARVQGRQTEPSVLNALDWFRAHAAEFDVLLICRGGGSRTDLAWFDSEAIARAIATFPIPVVVGIGHERDISLLDFVGWRAKTPTAAASLLVDRILEAREVVESRLERILEHAREMLEGSSSDLEEQARQVPLVAKDLLEQRTRTLRDTARRLRLGAGRDLSSASRRVDEIASRLGPHASRLLARENERAEARRRRLLLLDPRRVVERGYAILRTETGAVLKNPAHAPSGTPLTAELKSGALRLRSEGPEKK